MGAFRKSHVSAYAFDGLSDNTVCHLDAIRRNEFCHITDLHHDEIGTLLVFAPMGQLNIELANIVDACYWVTSRCYVAIHDSSRKYARLVGAAFHHDALAIDRHVAPRRVFRAIRETVGLLFARKNLVDIVGPGPTLGRVNVLNPNRAGIVHHVTRQTEIDHRVVRPPRPITFDIAHK